MLLRLEYVTRRAAAVYHQTFILNIGDLRSPTATHQLLQHWVQNVITFVLEGHHKMGNVVGSEVKMGIKQEKGEDELKVRINFEQLAVSTHLSLCYLLFANQELSNLDPS